MLVCMKCMMFVQQYYYSYTLSKVLCYNCCDDNYHYKFYSKVNSNSDKFINIKEITNGWIQCDNYLYNRWCLLIEEIRSKMAIEGIYLPSNRIIEIVINVRLNTINDYIRCNTGKFLKDLNTNTTSSTTSTTSEAGSRAGSTSKIDEKYIRIFDRIHLHVLKICILCYSLCFTGKNKICKECYKKLGTSSHIFDDYYIPLYSQNMKVSKFEYFEFIRKIKLYRIEFCGEYEYKEASNLLICVMLQFGNVETNMHKIIFDDGIVFFKKK